MSKTVCELKYIDCIPYKYVAVEFCHVNFMGDDAELYSKQWCNIEYDKFYKAEDEFQSLRNKLNKLYSEHKSLNDDRTFFQKIIKNYNTPNWKRKAELDIEINITEKRIIELGRHRFDEASQLVEKTRDFLNNNNFLITSHSANGDRIETHYEIWTREV